MREKERRVLHLRSSGSLLGAENVILEIAKFSIQNGWESIIGVINNINDPCPDILKVADKYNIKHVLFECRGRLDFKCIRDIEKYIHKLDIDIIHTHGYKENMYTFFMKNHLSRVATNHLWKNSRLKSKIYCALDAFIIRYFDKVVGVSDQIVNQMEKLRVNNVSKISNGVDVVKFEKNIRPKNLIEKYNLSKNDIVLGMISSLTYEKNHKIVIEALISIDNPDIKLIIIGDGYLNDSLVELVESSMLSVNVVFAGRQENIVDFLSFFDVFLLPSLSEGLPIAMLEAMSCGRAVIASRVGEVPHVIQHRYNGLLVDPGNVDQLISAINLLATNNSLIDMYGKNARKTIIEGFSSERMARDYCDLYDSLIFVQ